MKKVDYLEIKIATTRTAFFNNLKDVIEEINIHDVLKLSSGENLPTHKMIDGKYPVFGGGGSTSLTHNVFNVDFETLAIGRVGARCGCVFKVPKQSWVTDNALYALTFDKRFKLEFLIHYLSYVDLNQYANRAAQPVISLKRISSINFPLIDIERQKDFIKIIEQAENGKTYFGEEYSELNNALKSVDSINQLQAELSSQLTQLTNLNQAILQEAVQGKLLSEPRFIGLNDEQDSEQIKNQYNHINQKNHSSDTGHELLKRIKAEKAALRQAQGTKKEKPLPAIKPEEIPFEIPESWVWCRLGEIAYITSGSTPSKDAFVKSGIPFLKMYNLRNQEIDFHYKPQYIKEEVHNGQLKRCRAYPGDILMNIVGPPLGKIAIIPDSLPECNFNQAAVLIRPYAKEINYYINYFLNEKSEINAINTKGVAGQDNISVTQAQSIRIPLPPLSEQKRIVAAIEKQLAKTKQLKEHVIANQHATEQLLKALLHGAFEPAEALAQVGEVEEKEEV
jgi:type I restriction enzyme S subunit